MIGYCWSMFNLLIPLVMSTTTIHASCNAADHDYHHDQHDKSFSYDDNASIEYWKFNSNSTMSGVHFLSFTLSRDRDVAAFISPYPH